VSSERATRSVALAATVVVGALACACSSSASSSSTTTAKGATSTTSSSTTSTSAPSTSTTTAPVSNLTASPAIKAQLLAAGAAYNKLSPKDYVGLAPGQTYLAIDNTTGIKWAGISLHPSSSSQPAEVASQDEGGYMILSETPGDTWTVAALTGGQATCPAGKPPASIVALWGWTTGTCNPTS